MPAYENVKAAELPTSEPERMRHLQRYHFAARWAAGKVLDAGCAYGMCSYMMAHAGTQYVVGADRDELAIHYAQKHSMPIEPGRVRFMVVPDLEDAEALDVMQFDTIVAIEVLEHLQEPVAFLNHWKQRVWRVIITVPGIPSKGVNPYHLHDLHEHWVEPQFPPGDWNLLERSEFVDKNGRLLSICYAYDRRG